MHGDGWVDQVAPKSPKPCEDAIFVRASEPGIADDVGHQDRRELPRLAHGNSAMVRFHAALEEGVEAGSASLCVGPSPYPRRVKHSTVGEGAIDAGGALDPAQTAANCRITSL